jgi:predicted RNase H-like HicB family nuclease
MARESPVLALCGKNVDETKKEWCRSDMPWYSCPNRTGRPSMSSCRLFPRHTWGENVEDALRNAREVIELCLEQRSATGEEIPAGDSSQELASSVSVALPAA